MNKLGQSNAFLELVFLFHLLSSGLLSRPSELPFDQGSCWELRYEGRGGPWGGRIEPAMADGGGKKSLLRGLV